MSIKITKREWRLVLLVGLWLALLTAVPYALAHWTAQPGLVFSGTLMNPEDSQTYFAKMNQGVRGEWAYTIPFTPEPHEPAYVGVYYLVLGQIVRLSGLSLLTVWHGARAISVVLLTITVYWFINLFVADRRERRWALLWSLFGSGLGWLLFATGQIYWLDAFPVDFKQPGSHLFFTALTYPHISLATCLILASVGFTWRLGQAPPLRWRWAWLAGLVNVGLSVTYPYMIYLVALIAVLFYGYLLWQERRINRTRSGQMFLAFGLTLPLNLYYLFVLSSNRVFATWSDQSVIVAAPWPHYLLAYAPLLLLAGMLAWKRPLSRREFALLWLWLLAVVILLLLPVNAQRRFIQGVHVPLSVLGVLGVLRVGLPWLQRQAVWQGIIRRPRYSAASLSRFLLLQLLLFISLSNIYLWLDMVRVAVLVQPDPLFRTAAEVTATDWLTTAVAGAPETAVVLGEYQTGSYVGAHSPVKVIAGHWTETLDFDRKQAQIQQFYDATTDAAWRLALLDEYSIDYVWHGPREQELGEFDPATAAYLQPVYTHEMITIYRVVMMD